MILKWGQNREIDYCVGEKKNNGYEVWTDVSHWFDISTMVYIICSQEIHIV